MMVWATCSYVGEAGESTFLSSGTLLSQYLSYLFISDSLELQIVTIY